jgi:hypothetical protein
MTHPGVDLSVIGSENKRMTHAGIPSDPVRSDWVRPVPAPVRKKLCRIYSIPFMYQLSFVVDFVTLYSIFSQTTFNIFNS